MRRSAIAASTGAVRGLVRGKKAGGGTVKARLKQTRNTGGTKMSRPDIARVIVATSTIVAMTLALFTWFGDMGTGPYLSAQAMGSTRGGAACETIMDACNLTMDNCYGKPLALCIFFTYLEPGADTCDVCTGGGDRTCYNGTDTVDQCWKKYPCIWAGSPASCKKDPSAEGTDAGHSNCGAHF